MSLWSTDIMLNFTHPMKTAAETRRLLQTHKDVIQVKKKIEGNAWTACWVIFATRFSQWWNQSETHDNTELIYFYQQRSQPSNIMNKRIEREGTLSRRHLSWNCGNSSWVSSGFYPCFTLNLHSRLHADYLKKKSLDIQTVVINLITAFTINFK